jgi:RecA DNA recombination protein
MQKIGGQCAFIEAEHALDTTEKLGVSLPDLMIGQPDNVEQALEIVDALVRSGSVDLIVIDSVAALMPKAELDGDMGDSLPGLQARLMSQALCRRPGTLTEKKKSGKDVTTRRSSSGRTLIWPRDRDCHPCEARRQPGSVKPDPDGHCASQRPLRVTGDSSPLRPGQAAADQSSADAVWIAWQSTSSTGSNWAIWPPSGLRGRTVSPQGSGLRCRFSCSAVRLKHRMIFASRCTKSTIYPCPVMMRNLPSRLRLKRAKRCLSIAGVMLYQG